MTEQKSSTLHEQPIQNAEHDRLNFTAYVDQLMEFIEKHKTPLTIGIYGEWGSGKTSLMRLLEERLKKEPKRYCTVWFTAWRYGGDTATLRRTFLLSILSALARRKRCDEIKYEAGERPVLRRWWQHLRRSWWHRLHRSESSSPPRSPTKEDIEFCKELDNLTVRLYQALEWEQQSARFPSLSDTLQLLLSLGTALPKLSPFSTFRDSVQGPQPKRRTRTSKEGKEITEAYPLWEVSIRYREQIRYLEEFSEKFKDLLDKKGSPCSNSEARVVIFIDDLDRCLPEHALTVLETLKLFLDVEKTIFIMGMDPALVEKGIQHHYHWQEPSPLQVHQYMSKIVHIPYQIPRMSSEALIGYTQELMAQLPFTDKILYLQRFHENQAYLELLREGVIRNPRHIKQLINLWGVLLAYLLEHPYEQVRGEELFTLLMTKRQWPDFFRTWVQNPALILQDQKGIEEIEIANRAYHRQLQQFLRYIAGRSDSRSLFNLQPQAPYRTLYRAMDVILNIIPPMDLQDDRAPLPPSSLPLESRQPPTSVIAPPPEERPTKAKPIQEKGESRLAEPFLSPDALARFRPVLLLHIQSTDGLYRVTCEGEQWNFAFPWEKENLLAQLYRARVLTKQEAKRAKVTQRASPFRMLQQARRHLKEMGDQLYEALFPPDSSIRQSLETRLREAYEQGRILSLRLQLDPDDAELWAFPWELLYAHWIEDNGEIKTTFTQTLYSLAIVRYLPRKEAKPIFTRMQHIAFFAASPKGRAIPTHQTFEAIRSVWGQGRMLDLGGQKWEDWLTLMDQSPDAVHFLGHGDKQDRLDFVRENNDHHWVEAEEIANSLPASLKLLVLQACFSSHLAARLIQKHPHLPLAVGMHYEISAEVADAFAQGFYRTLLTSGRVEVAIAQARQRMLDNSKNNQWLLPVLTMGVPEAYFSSKAFSKVSRRLPVLTHAVEREQLPALQERLFHHPLLTLAGKPGSGRTWLALQALEKAGFPREQMLLFDLSQGGDIYALWHALLDAFELPQVQHLYAPILTEDRWKAMKQGLSQALQKEPHALLIKLPSQPPQDTQREGWQYLFEALAAKAPQVGQTPSSHPPQTIFILNQEGKSAWLDLSGQDVPSLTLKLSEEDIVKLLQAYEFPAREDDETIEAIRKHLSDKTIWQLRQWLESYEGPKELDKLLEILEREGFSLKGRWERFSPLEQEILKWAAIAGGSITPTDVLEFVDPKVLQPAQDLLPHFSEYSQDLRILQEAFVAPVHAGWLQQEGSEHCLVPAARSFVLEQMKRKERRQRLKRWHRHQAPVEQAARVEMLLDDDALEEVARLLLSETWHPWQISPAYRYKLLEFIDELWKKEDALPSTIPFKLGMRAALAARALGNYQTAIMWYERADKVASTPDEHLQALIELAFLRHRTGSSDWEEIAKDVEDLLKEVQNPQLHAQWHFTLGTIYAEQLRYSEAVEAVEAGLQHLGLAGLNLSPEKAATTFSSIRRALKRWVRQGGSPLLAAQAMRTYGLAMLYRDDLEAAEHAFRLSLDFYEETNDRYWIAIAHNNLAAALNRAGRTAEAEEHFQRAKPILAQLGDPTFAEMLQHFNGALSREFQITSYPKGIVPGIAKALTLARDYRYLQAIVPILLEYGKALAMAGRWDEATAAMEEARRWATTELRNPLMAHWADLYRAEINLYRWQAGETELSLAPLSQWPQEPPESWKQDPRLEIASRLHLAQACVLQGDLEEAQKIIAPVKPEAIHDPATLTKWHQLQGTLLAAQKEHEKAETAFKEGLKQQGLVVYRTQLRYHYAQALLQAQKPKLARAQLAQALEEAKQMEIPWLKEMIEKLQSQIREVQR